MAAHDTQIAVMALNWALKGIRERRALLHWIPSFLRSKGQKRELARLSYQENIFTHRLSVLLNRGKK